MTAKVGHANPSSINWSPSSDCTFISIPLLGTIVYTYAVIIGKDCSFCIVAFLLFFFLSLCKLPF